MKRIIFFTLAILTAIASATAQSGENGKASDAVQSRFQGVVGLGFHAVPGYPILSPYASVAKIEPSCRDKCCHVTVVVMDDIDDATTKKN